MPVPPLESLPLRPHASKDAAQGKEQPPPQQQSLALPQPSTTATNVSLRTASLPSLTSHPQPQPHPHPCPQLQINANPFPLRPFEPFGPPPAGLQQQTKESAIATAELKAMLDSSARLGGCGGSGFAALLEARDAEDVLYGAEGLTSRALLDGEEPQASGPTPAVIAQYHSDLVAMATGFPISPARPRGYPPAMGRWLRAPTGAPPPTAASAATTVAPNTNTTATATAMTTHTSEGNVQQQQQQQHEQYAYIHTWTQQMALERPPDAGPFQDELGELELGDDGNYSHRSSSKQSRSSAATKQHGYLTAFVGDGAGTKAGDEAGIESGAASLKSCLDTVLRAGKKVPLLLCESSAVHAKVLAEAVVWDGRGLDPKAWRNDRAAFEAKVATEQAAHDLTANEEYAAGVKQWHDDTEARKEKRREADLEGGAEYVSSDEEVDVEAVAPYPGPEWDGTYIVDTKPFVLPYKKTKVTVADHVEHCRKKIVRCMKAGGTLVIDLGDNCPDFANKISIKKYRGAFPIGLFNPAGHKKCSAGIFVRSKGDGPPTVKDGFAVVVVAQQSVATFKKELKDLTDVIHDHLAPVVVVGTRPTPIVGLADRLA